MKYEFVWTRCFQFSKSISDTYVYVKIRIFRWSVVCIEILDFVCGFRQMFKIFSDRFTSKDFREAYKSEV